MTDEDRPLGLGQRLPWSITEATVAGGHEEDAASLERPDQFGGGHQMASHSSTAELSGSGSGAADHSVDCGSSLRTFGPRAESGSAPSVDGPGSANGATSGRRFPIVPSSVPRSTGPTGPVVQGAAWAFAAWAGSKGRSCAVLVCACPSVAHSSAPASSCPLPRWASRAVWAVPSSRAVERCRTVRRAPSSSLPSGPCSGQSDST
jgi:hypothetical protein